ncbi:ABC1-domain-containing protein [Cucurbitaria berberidis CBS 394.84]|uniref:ABC1-domain-containing protein n=1 Tax=Cucurbitaria berberidis CBS 394.84 TaxID=1168544 RepID=A0A9P4GP12_9PLEO|nr:ABC1-domain-containing protein [Cucurbitaria berberidis CBS 394.84]KAF1850008.1 ABC1-domain-containing protein [Cucurbitaria berberidis CBS 394.84]
MSAFNAAFSPFLRRAWTCRGCLRSQRQALPQQRSTLAKRNTFASRADIRRTFATQVDAATTLIGKMGKRRRRLWIVGGGLAIGAGVVTINDDAKHAYVAAQRSYRVLGTLVLNIKDYRDILKRDSDPDYPEQLKACHLRCAKRTLHTLEKNGSIFIKLGQHLSSMSYLLPNEWCDTFIPLQDRCPVSSYESIQEMVRRDTGLEISDLFSEFEERPIGAASLAQVHRATIRETGQKVAVKVQHPALDEWSKLDLALTSFTFSTLKRWFPEYDLTWLSDEMQLSLPQELDFAREGENATRAREYFSHVHDVPVIIPKVIWAKRRILVMDYVAGFRTDDLKSLDERGIDRDEVSAALARIFNEMVFGRDAPLHCDPHGGNIAIRYNPKRRGKTNFDVVLYDHGLYRDIPLHLRRSYAKLWLAVLDADEPGMRKYAYEVAGIGEEHFPLFASAITGRDYTVLATKDASTGGGGVMSSRTNEEKKVIGDALGDGMLESLIQLLGQVPRVILLILKTNDLTRSLDEGLQTRQGPMRTFLILARYASRTVYEEQLDNLSGSILWPRNFLSWLGAWSRHMRVELQLSSYETYLKLRALLGFQQLVLGVDSFRE